MIPLRDNQPTSTFPIITVLLIAANILVYLGQQAMPGLQGAFEMIPYRLTHPFDHSNFLVLGTGQGLDVRRVAPGLYPTALPPDAQFVGPSVQPVWLTIFTAMFMHASLLHIGGNMLYLWIFGNNIEDALGKIRFLVFYFVCGIGATVMQVAVSPNSLIPSLGASGAIAGVLGAYLILYPNARVLTVFIAFLTELPALWVLVFWAVVDILPGFLQIGMPANGGVAYFAHFGGFVVGIVLIYLFGGKRLVARQQRRVFYPPPSGGGGYH